MSHGRFPLAYNNSASSRAGIKDVLPLESSGHSGRPWLHSLAGAGQISSHFLELTVGCLGVLISFRDAPFL